MLQRILLFGRQLGGHVGSDEAGRHHVHGNPPRAHFTRQGLGETDDTGLGRGVIRLSGVSHHPHHRSHADNPSAPRFHHPPQHGLGQPEHRRQIGVENVVPFLILHAQQEIVARDASVIHQHCDIALRCFDILQCRVDRFGLHDIQRDAPAFKSGASECLRDLLRPGIRRGSSDHRGALARELQRNGLADTTRSARHQCNLAIQTGFRHIDSLGSVNNHFMRCDELLGSRARTQ